MALPELGTYFWISTEDESWFPYKLEDFEGEKAVLKSPSGKTTTMEKGKLASLQVVHPTCLKGLDDMVHLGDLHEAGLLHTIRDRFENDKIYTYTGAILVSVNPYQTLPIYTNEIMHSYRNERIGALPPHIFAIADNAYRNMCEHSLDQSIIISGESGAGKTEATKLILQYLAAVSGHHSWVEQQILDSSPVLEAFGNAKTIRNDNSSRFGKFIEIHFDQDNRICGASIINYLLEKSRIVSQAADERNYHIFYQITMGATEEEREKYGILSPEDYHYLNQSGCMKIAHVNDAEEFDRVKMALSVLNMSDDEIDAIFRILSGILMIGNVKFRASADGESCTVENPEVVSKAATIFGTTVELLANALVNRTNVIAGNAITVPLKHTEAVEGRDAFAKSIYGRMFDWIVSRINDSIRQGKKKNLIGVLDIFGFEIFKQNSFEQLCINFANEKLQQHFNQFIFKTEQEEYMKEKISWSNIDFVDNQECIDLVEKKPLGIVSLIDEICKAPKGGDQMMLEKFHKNHEKNPYYEKPRVNNGTFGVKHYAGSVTYNIEGFTDKNKDTLYFDYIEAMQNSKSESVRALFPEDNPKSKDKEKKRAPTTKQTVAIYFKEQLTSLMSTLNATQPHYVRCLKPNTTKSARKIESSFLFRQLKYAGMVEAVRIRRLGFPVRRTPQEFINRFWMIGNRGIINDSELCKSIFSNAGADSGSWQIGLTKIFTQEITYQSLESVRAKKIKDAVQKIQGYWRMKKISRYFRILQKSVKLSQPRIRGWLGRRKFKKLWLERDQARSKAETTSLGIEDRYCRSVWNELNKIERDRQAAERQMMKGEEKYQREVILENIKLEKIRQYNESKRLRQEEIYQIQVMIAIEQQKMAEKAKKEAEEAARIKREAEEAERVRRIAEEEEKAKRQAELEEKRKQEAIEKAASAAKALAEAESLQKEAQSNAAKSTGERESAPVESANTLDDLSEMDRALQELINEAEAQKDTFVVESPVVSPPPPPPVMVKPTIIPEPPVIPTKVPEPPAIPTKTPELPAPIEPPKVPEPVAPAPPVVEAPNALMSRLAAMDELDDLDSILNQLEGEKADIEKKIADVVVPEEVVERKRTSTLFVPSTKMQVPVNPETVEDESEKPPFIPEVGCYIRAKFDYDASDGGLLSLTAGDLIIVIQVDEGGGWCRGECKGVVGWFPLEYIEPVEEEEFPDGFLIDNESIQSGQVVRALFDFDAADSSQLSFKKGDLITIIENDDSGWCQGSLRDEVGWFPYDYVELVGKEEKKPELPPTTPAPKAEEGNIYVDCTVEIHLPKDIHKYSFEEFAKKNFAQQRTGTFRKKTIEAVDLTLFSKDPMKHPLLLNHNPDHADSLVHLSHSIMKFMGDYPSKKDSSEILKYIVNTGVTNEEFRDELYCNLCRQLTTNPNPESVALGWELMSICVGGTSASFCQKTLARVVFNGARKFSPTAKELEVLRKKKPYILRIHFVDGESKGCAVELQTTAKEVVMHLCKRVGIKAHPAFCLYEQSGGTETLLKPQQLIMDILARWEQENITDGKLIFKNLLYLKSFNESKEEGLISMLYKQAVRFVVNGTYVCSNDEALLLGALQCMIEIGSSKATVSQIIGSNPEKFLPSRVTSGKLPAECVKLLNEKYQMLLGSGKTYKNARDAYITICKTWSFFGMGFYPMEQSVAVGNIPTKFILGVNSDGVNFLDPNTKAILRTVRFGDVTNWGFSASTFVIITGDLRHQQKFLLKTKQGTEISELVQSYINCIVD